MAIVKDPTIVDLLDRLDIDDRGWIVNDHWDGDLCAIGIATEANPQRLVYVSTYNKGDERYYCECEIPNQQSPLGYDVVCKKDDISFGDLRAIMEWHLSGGDSKLQSVQKP